MTDTPDRPYSFSDYDRVALWEIDTKLMEHHARIRRTVTYMERLDYQIGLLQRDVDRFRERQAIPQPSIHHLQLEIEQLHQSNFALGSMISLQFDMLRRIQEAFQLHSDSVIWTLWLRGIHLHPPSPHPPSVTPSLATRRGHLRTARRSPY